MTGIDLRRRVVHASPGEDIPYDYLVLATGSTNNYRGSEQLAENSIGLKTLEDGTHLRNHVLACLERADSETDPAERRALLTFVVAGGGPGESSTRGRSANCCGWWQAGTFRRSGSRTPMWCWCRARGGC